MADVPFPRRVAQIRRGLGWSQQQLAQAADLSISTIRNVEAGHPVLPDTVRAIADALEVPVLRLYGLQEEDGDVDPVAV